AFDLLRMLRPEYLEGLQCHFYSLFQSNSLINLLAHNALLRGEQRNTDAAAYHLNHQKLNA
ncbi:hypothetical protein, partial [Vibrio parahaemolyticus]|uniref:hypothetical protein n=1 Tax=Vibrio parahaemolyticus TaxID=670 RepID=UPI002DD65573